MELKTLNCQPEIPIQNPKFKRLHNPLTFFNQSHVHFSLHCHRKSRVPSSLRIFHAAANNRDNRFITACISPSQEILGEDSKISHENDESMASVSSIEEEETEVVESKREEFAANDSIWNQMVEIVKFSGPATGLWICGPLMSLIDTAVIGQQSSLALAALGPGTVLCSFQLLHRIWLLLEEIKIKTIKKRKERHKDISWFGNGAYVHTEKDKDEVQHQISILLFVGLTCGVLMLFFTRFLGAWALTAFTGPKNVHIIPAANTFRFEA